MTMITTHTQSNKNYEYPIYKIECDFSFGLGGEDVVIEKNEEITYKISSMDTRPIERILYERARDAYQTFLTYDIQYSSKIKKPFVNFTFPQFKGKSARLHVSLDILESDSYYNIERDCLQLLNVEEPFFLIKGITPDGEEKVLNIPISIPRPTWICGVEGATCPEVVKHASIEFANRYYHGEYQKSVIFGTWNHRDKWMEEESFRTGDWSCRRKFGAYFPKKNSQDEGLFIGEHITALIKKDGEEVITEGFNFKPDDYEGYKEFRLYYYGQPVEETK